jgi:hypothetical protein
MGQITRRVRPPIEVQTRARRRERDSDLRRDFQRLRKEPGLYLVAEEMREHLQPVAALSETKPASVPRCQEVMVSCDAGFADEQPAASHQLFIAVDTNVEILVSLVAREGNMHVLNDARSRLDVEKRRVRKKTLGRGVSSRPRDVSGPKKITVGCVILIVPRRKRISRAVTDETASARTDRDGRRISHTV